MKSNCTNPAWIGRAECAVCDVRGFVLFSGLSTLELDAILQPIDNLRVPQNAVLYEQDSAAPCVYTLRSGLIKLKVDLPNGGRRIVRLLRPGDVAGMETLVGERYHHTAVALQDADVCRIPREVVLRLDQTNPAVHQALMRRWQRSVDQADHFIVALSTGSAEARMARLLITLGCTGSQPDTSMPSREDMGALLGITTETASRVVAEFRRRGLIHIEKGDCVAYDHAGLTRLAQG
ncbi:MAG: Crp/Fnr family transcriptional regulator [Gammaproteobacteria bacterium]|jgi:CRP-like cAMP-binding protein|nr:Crp/Fnr family transcriptional regulator [Gammaproteobacteria bacterium]MBU1408345.1 Crp/Fnr family transcriptional regulator [Gammaproteobacteria bacterium]MBU1532157.1 Crp/Fnr family transcriptional regulator [Gammaproteobacteria bacterium]